MGSRIVRVDMSNLNEAENFLIPTVDGFGYNQDTNRSVKNQILGTDLYIDPLM